jgi:hypothetical protein
LPEVGGVPASFPRTRLEAVSTNILTSVDDVNTVKTETNLFHATLKDYGIAIFPPDKTTDASKYLLYYDDANKKIVACLGKDAYNLSPRYGVCSDNPNSGLILTDAGSCANLTPYISVKSRIDNHDRDEDTTFYNLYDVGTRPTGDFYYETGNQSLFSELRKSIDGNFSFELIKKDGAYFLWKGTDGEIYNESGSTVCDKKSSLGSSVCLGSGSDVRLNWCFARPLNKLVYDIWPGYFHAYYWPLYIPRYSGGLENIINLQQDLEGKTLTTFGSFSSMWESEELWRSNGMRSYFSSDQSIYKAPKRRWYYNSNLKNNQPPGSPSLYGLERGPVKEEALDDLDD